MAVLNLLGLQLQSAGAAGTVIAFNVGKGERVRFWEDAGWSPNPLWSSCSRLRYFFVQTVCSGRCMESKLPRFGFKTEMKPQ